MPDGRQVVYGPANQPMFNPAPTRLDRRKWIGGDPTLKETPPFSNPGSVFSAPYESPAWPVPTNIAGDINRYVITCSDFDEIHLTINVNYVAQATVSIVGGATPLYTVGIVAIAIVPGDVVTVEWVPGSYFAENLCIVLRMAA